MKGFKKHFLAIVLVVAMLTLVACGGTAGDKDKDDDGAKGQGSLYPMTIVDDLGNEVTIEKEPETIVSVAPSNTEILFALGLGDKMIGRSEYCNYPAEALKLEVVGAYSGPNTELILELEPDILFAANSVPDEAKQLMEASGIKVVIFNPNSIDEVLSNMEVIAKICNVQEEGTKLVGNLQEKRAEIKEKLKSVEPRKVFFDLGGFITVGKGSFINSIFEEIKAVNIAAGAEGQWPTVSLEQVVEANPDVYISTYPTIEELTAIAGLSEVAAFKNDEVYVLSWGTENHDIIQRPGPRIGRALELYVEMIYPELD